MMETIEFDVFALLDTPVFFVSVIASLGENRVLKAQTDSLQETKSREEGSMVQILSSSGRTYVVVLGSACKSPLESSVLPNERISSTWLSGGVVKVNPLR